MPLLMPVTPTSMASWGSHQRRSPKSTEPGTDMFVPIGTPVVAPADGRVYGYGTTIGPATGRWVGIDFDNGMRWRAMHHSRLSLSTAFMNNRGFVRAGTTVALSGASGYGYEDWSRLPGMPGPHTHVTLWPTHASRFGYDRNGKPYTVDFMAYADTSTPAAAGGRDEDDMTPQERKMLQDTHDMMSQVIDYLGARGGMNTPSADTLGEHIKTIRNQTQETRDFLGARGGMNTTTQNSLGFKIDALFKRWGKG